MIGLPRVYYNTIIAVDAEGQQQEQKVVELNSPPLGNLDTRRLILSGCLDLLWLS
jgi:hypothetical protein